MVALKILDHIDFFPIFVNYESSNASSIVDDGMKGRGLLLLGVPLVPLVPI